MDTSIYILCVHVSGQPFFVGTIRVDLAVSAAALVPPLLPSSSSSRKPFLSATSSFCSLPTCPTLNQSKKRRPSHSRNIFCKSNQVLNSHNSITHISGKRCECFDLYKELIPYNEAWSWQKRIVKEKKALIERNEECPDTLIILQHSPVYTMGSASSEEYLNFDLKDPPFQVYRTERGGEVTYHGPGQLVVYPIINLRNHKMDLHWYLRALEEVVIRVLLSTFAIKASRLEDLTGVWVGDQKLAAIGIRVSQWITYHGLALNVTTDLTPFRWIVPCGLQNRQVGSIKRLLGECQLLPADFRDSYDHQLLDITHNSLIKEFSEVFQLDIHHKTLPAIELLDKNIKVIH